MTYEDVISKSGRKPTPRTSGKSEVVVKRGGTPYEMVVQVFSELDVDRVIEAGDTVLVKPNFSMLWSLPWKGSLTSPEFLEATVKAVKERTKAREIIIAEGGGGTQTWQSFFQFKVPEMAQKYGTGLVDLNWDVMHKVDVPEPYEMREMWVAETAHDRADVIISVPVLKGWGGTGVTLSLKNMMGVLPGRYYGWAKGKIPHGKNDPADRQYGQSKTLSGAVTDICFVNRPNIALIDALTVMYPRELPKPGAKMFKTVPQVDELNMVIGGFDPVATDTVATAVMGLNPARILHFQMAASRGLGVNDLKRITVLGEPIERVKHPVNPWQPDMEELRETKTD
ncbi:MAG: DUF362 domain-containing protein [Candidatus Bathyarchaeia archaeon]